MSTGLPHALRSAPISSVAKSELFSSAVVNFTVRDSFGAIISRSVSLRKLIARAP